MTHWKFFTDANNEAKARKVLAWVIEKLNLETIQLQTESYHKGGFVLSFDTKLKSKDWPSRVLEVIESAQNVGHGWYLTSLISVNLDATCNSPSIAGVTFIHVVCLNDQGV